MCLLFYGEIRISADGDCLLRVLLHARLHSALVILFVVGRGYRWNEKLQQSLLTPYCELGTSTIQKSMHLVARARDIVLSAGHLCCK